eukprot:SAG31_NODE_28339_length_411_cov_1.160256_1_plen_122_part_10
MAAQPAALVSSTLSLAAHSGPGTGPPIGIGVPGCCGGPRYSKGRKSCDTDGRGYWPARQANITDLAACVHAVSACKMGNFASFYPASGSDDGACGWHRSCAGWPSDVASCINISSAYVSARV